MNSTLRLVSKLLFVSLAAVLFFGGCGKKVQSSQYIEKPDWIVAGQFVGHARKTASGNIGQQKELAINRALGSLLMSQGVVKGKGVVSSKMTNVVSGKKDSLVELTDIKHNGEIVYKQRSFNIRLKNIWEHPRTGELYVQIEEVK